MVEMHEGAGAGGLTSEETAVLKELAENYRTGRTVWKWLVKLGMAASAIAAFFASIALAWQAMHGR